MPLEISENVKVVIFVPTTHVEAVREAIGEKGAGVIGCYDYCSFITPGIGHFRPLNNLVSHLGDLGQKYLLNAVEEVKIETVCHKNLVEDVIKAAQEVHPYPVMGYDLLVMYDLVD